MIMNSACVSESPNIWLMDPVDPSMEGEWVNHVLEENLQSSRELCFQPMPAVIVHNIHTVSTWSMLVFEWMPSLRFVMFNDTSR